MERSLSHIEKSPIEGPTDRLLAEAEVSRLNQRLYYLIQVIQHITVAHDLNSIMTAVKTGARRLIGADGATFVLRDGELCYYADEDAISPLWKGRRFPLSSCISGWVMLNQQSVVIEDIYADPRIPADAYRPTFVKSLVMVPIRTRNPLGAIGNYWATHHAPIPEEVQLLQTLADAAAVALENLGLYEEQEHKIQEHTDQLQRALDFEALLKRITDKVRDSLDEQQILATVVQELTQGLASNRCDTMLYNLEQATASICYQYEHPSLIVGCSSTIAMSEFPELYLQLLQGETFQFCHLPQSDAQLNAETESLILICPIIDDQCVLGDIRLYRASVEPFTELEVRLVQQVANQCAIALRQARLHRDVQAQVTELEKLNQLKDDFLSTISHELRTPISSMKMAIQMLKVVLGLVNSTTYLETNTNVILSHENFSKATNYLQILSKECERETDLINNLLDLTYLKAETTSGTLQNVHLQEWIPQVAAPFRERIQQRKQQLQIYIPDRLPALKTNQTVLGRILTELLQNACKHTPIGETITISAMTCETVTCETVNIASDYPTSGQPMPSPSLLLTVSNSGVEISNQDRVHIFDKFYRIPSHDPWKNGGTGLGLALVKQLVKQISGSIEVTSNNNFVCFTVKLTSNHS